MIPDEIVERVRDAADIVEVIGEQVKLRRAGADFRGPCPFHQGRNPNFAVSPRKGIYHCYKCGVSGDVFTFLREQQGLSFTEAVRQLGHRFGVPVPEADARAGRQRDDREPLWETLGAAAAFFQDELWNSVGAAPVRDYLQARSVSREAAESFGLGFAPRDGDLLRGHLRTLGFDDDRQVEVGLLTRRDDGSSGVRFRNRLIFPIADIGSHVVGFGGRLIGPGEPRYLNSPETRVFVKGQLLFNMDRAKQGMRREDRVLLTEGYFDVLRLVTNGVEAVVASLGTALAEAQAALLTRYTRNAFLLYDSDEAGLKATFRSGLELLRHGMSVRVVTLPDGEDPDTFVARYGPERLEKQLNSAIDLFERQIQILDRHGWFADLHRKRRAVDKLLPTIRAAADSVTRDMYLARLSELTGVERSALQQEADAPSRRGRAGAPEGSTAMEGGPARTSVGWRENAPSQPPPAPSAWRRGGGRGGPRGAGQRRGGRWWQPEGPTELVDASTPRPGDRATLRAERSLVLAMVHKVGYIASVSERVQPERFRDPRYAEIFALLVEQGEMGDPAAMADELSPDAVVELQELLAAGGELTAPREIVEDSLAKIEYFELTDQIEELRHLMANATGERREALEEEQGRLVVTRRALGLRGNWSGKLGK